MEDVCVLVLADTLSEGAKKMAAIAQALSINGLENLPSGTSVRWNINFKDDCCWQILYHLNNSDDNNTTDTHDRLSGKDSDGGRGTSRYTRN